MGWQVPVRGRGLRPAPRIKRYELQISQAHPLKFRGGQGFRRRRRTLNKTHGKKTLLITEINKSEYQATFPVRKIKSDIRGQLAAGLKPAAA
jgi:hypothetical protein